MKTALLIASSALLISCTSEPFYPTTQISENYRPVVGAAGNRHNVEPQYIHAGSADEAKALYQQYLNAGYHLVGFSTFTHVFVPMDLNAPNPNDMLDQARKVRADIVLYYTVPQGYVEMNVPVVSQVDPSTSSRTIINAQDDTGISHQIGTATTWTPGQIHWQFGQRSCLRAANYVEFLAR
jgi:hypothetical protein